jgi:hypothetical protein
VPRQATFARWSATCWSGFVLGRCHRGTLFVMAERVRVREIDSGEDRARDIIRTFDAGGFASLYSELYSKLYPKYAGGRPRSCDLPDGSSVPGIRPL